MGLVIVSQVKRISYGLGWPKIKLFTQVLGPNNLRECLCVQTCEL